MYTHRNASLSRAAESLANFLSPQDASTASPMQYAAAPHPQHHQVALGEFDSEASSNNTYNSCGSGCTSYMGSPSSLASYESRRVQRSVSSHSLQKNSGGPHHPFSPLFAQLLDSQNGPVRRACSTGDLQVPSSFDSLIINTHLLNYTNTVYTLCTFLIILEIALSIRTLAFDNKVICGLWRQNFISNSETT